MIENTRSHAVLLARAGAIVFALSACGYLVVTAQRNANPPATATVEAVVTPPQVPAQGETFLQGSKSLVLDASDVVEVVEEAPIEARVDETGFLSSSKTLNWTAHPNPPPLVVPPIPAATESAPAASAEFLPSSKVGVIATPEPVFLPSSKVKVLSPLPAQTATGGVTSTVAPVFLPSSKSLRVEVQKPPPKNP